MLIQIMISLIISYLLQFIPISKPKKAQKIIHLSLISHTHTHTHTYMSFKIFKKFKYF